MVYGERQAAPNIDPSQFYDWSTRMMQQALYDALLKYEGNPPKVVPWLAKSYRKSADGKKWTFELVRNAKIQNGDPVNAQAVKWSFERPWPSKRTCLDAHGFPRQGWNQGDR